LNEHDATEIAYRNGFEDGKKAARLHTWQLTLIGGALSSWSVRLGFQVGLSMSGMLNQIRRHHRASGRG